MDAFSAKRFLPGHGAGIIAESGLERFAAKLAEKNVLARVTFGDGRVADFSVEEYAKFRFSSGDYGTARVVTVECSCEPMPHLSAFRLAESHSFDCPAFKSTR